MKKILFLTLFLFGLSFLIAQPVSADVLIPGTCTLTGPGSICDPGDKMVYIKNDFIKNVINPGIGFPLKKYGNLEIELAGGVFRVENAGAIYFEDSGFTINNDALEIRLTATQYPGSYIDMRKVNINKVKEVYLEASYFDQGLIYAKDIFAEKEVKIFAGKKIFFENITITDPPENTLENATIVEVRAGEEVRGGHFDQDEGKWVGGVIFNQPDFWVRTGNGGNITVEGKRIIIGNLSAAGYGGMGNSLSIGKGGKIAIYGENIITKDISVQSVRGGAGVPLEKWADVYGNAGQIVIKKDELGNPDSDWVTYFKADDIQIQGMAPSDLSIKAEELIQVEKISAYSGCDINPGSRKSVCDYPVGFCPDIVPEREYCEKFYPSGSIELISKGKSSFDWTKGEWEKDEDDVSIDNGIIIGIGIDNRAVSNHPEVDSPSGAGNVGEVILKAENGQISIDGGVYYMKQGWAWARYYGIISVGFHNHPAEAIKIEGKHIFLRGIISTENSWLSEIPFHSNMPEPMVFPTELVGTNIGTGAGDISIVSKDLDFPPGQSITPELHPDTFIFFWNGEFFGSFQRSGISTKASYPFAQNGGNVSLSSDYLIDKIDKTYTVPFCAVIKIDTSASLLGVKKRYETWWLKDGVSLDPYTGNVITDLATFCDDGTKEYFEGTNAGDFSTGKYKDGPDGGNGGNINILARVLAPRYMVGAQYLEKKIILHADGAGGSRGGSAGYTNYCSKNEYTGARTHTIPEGGKGGRGGRGGNGGEIKIGDVVECRLHCLSEMELSAEGGRGGYGGKDYWLGGTFVIPESGSGAFNKYTGNCDLDGWNPINPAVSVPERQAPVEAGDGGDGGIIHFSPAPTDIVVEMISAFAGGRYGGSLDYESKLTLPYPFYCTWYKIGPDLFAIKTQIDNEAAAAKTTYDDTMDSCDDYLELCEPALNLCLAPCNSSLTVCTTNCGPEPSRWAMPEEKDAWNACMGVCYSTWWACIDNCGNTYDACINTDQRDRCWENTAISYMHDLGTIYFGDPQCCTKAVYVPLGYDSIPSGTCYDDSGFRAMCRPKLVQTPCQNIGFTMDEGGCFYYLNEYWYIDSAYLWGNCSGSRFVTIPRAYLGSKIFLAQARGGVFNGQNGADGGKGGEIKIDTKVLPTSDIGLGISGGSGKKGTNGQNTSLDAPGGDGGNGGNGGDAGQIFFSHPDWIKKSGAEGRFYGGDKGEGGYRGGMRSGASLPRADLFSGFYYYNPFGGDSCQTLAPGSDEYSVNANYINFSENSFGTAGDDGTDGVDAIDGSGNFNPARIHSIDEARPSGGFTCLDGFQKIDIPIDDGEEGNCCDGIDNDGNGFTDCQDIVNCFDDCYTINTQKGHLIRSGVPFDCRMPNPNIEWRDACEVNICRDNWDNDEWNDGIDLLDITDCHFCGNGIIEPWNGEECDGGGVIIQDGCPAGQLCDLNCKCIKPNDPPTAINLSVTQQNDCFWSNPIVRFSWTFSDPDPGDTQSAYELEIADNAVFNNPIQLSGGPDTFREYAGLSFNTPYWWQVRVQDTNGPTWSEWAYPPNNPIAPPFPTLLPGTSFTTENRYPWPDFEWAPDNPEEDEDVSFQALCLAGFCNSYFWTFEEGDPSSSNETNPIVQFASSGNKTVELSATDLLNHTCTVEDIVPVGEVGVLLPPPKWIEIPPF